MKHWIRVGLMAAALLGASTATVWAHGPERGGPGNAHHVQRMDELKTKLRLDAAQENAWKTYADAMVQAHRNAWPDRAAMDKMTTPERIDQMQAWHQRMGEDMKKRGEATKNFYAALNSEQKKTFDAETMRKMPGAEGRRMHRHPH